MSFELQSHALLAAASIFYTILYIILSLQLSKCLEFSRQLVLVMLLYLSSLLLTGFVGCYFHILTSYKIMLAAH